MAASVALVKPVPVSLLSGFLGAGKTSCLSHLLTNAGGLRIGVVVNDVAALNIDAELIADVAQGPSDSSDDSIVRLQNGCACCSLADDLNNALRTLSQSGSYDHLIVELSGVAEPDLAKSNLKREVSSDDLLLDRVVTLVDASSFLMYFDADTRMSEQPELRETDEDGNAVDECADGKGASADLDPPTAGSSLSCSPLCLACSLNQRSVGRIRAPQRSHSCSRRKLMEPTSSW